MALDTSGLQPLDTSGLTPAGKAGSLDVSALKPLDTSALKEVPAARRDEPSVMAGEGIAGIPGRGPERPTPAPTPASELTRPRSAAASFMQGVGQTAAGIPKGVALMGAPDPEVWANLDRIDAGKPPIPKAVSAGGTAGAFGITAEVGNELYREYEEASPERRREIRDTLNQRAREATSGSEVYQVGNAIDEWFRENYPTNPEFQEEFWTAKVPQALGSAGTFLGVSALTRGGFRPFGRRVQNVGTYAAPAGAGGAMNSAELFEDALQEGADVSTALEAAGWGRLFGLSEAVPIGNLFNRMDRLGGGQIRRYLSRAIRQGTEEAVQEAFVGIMNDATAQGLYDPERGVWTSQRGEEAAVGFTTGAILETLMTLALPGRRRGGQIEVDPETGLPEGSVSAEMLIGGVEGQQAPAGEREKARAEAEPAMPEDVDSPLPTDLVVEGKEVAQDAMGEQNASRILEQAGFPPINAVVNIRNDAGEAFTGTVIDAFDEDGFAGVKIELDDGSILSGSFDDLRGRIEVQSQAQGQAQGQAQSQTTAEVPVMVTHRMKQQLGALGYTEQDVRGMRPEQAWEIIQSGRPREGSEEAEDAETVRGDAGQVRPAGDGREGREGEGGPDLQQQAEARPAAGRPEAPQGRPDESEAGVAGALPEGWREVQSGAGGLATNPDPETGGIVDVDPTTGRWFAIPNRDGAQPIEDLGSREEAIRAISGAERPAAEGPTEAAGEPIRRQDVQGDQARDTAVTATGREVAVRYAVVEAGDLVPSQQDDGRINPNYPAELQPRDRARAVSSQQIRDIAARLNPRLLDRSPRASDGAPIVAEDGVVESGNGRVLAIRRAYSQGLDTAEQYRAYLAEQGYPVEGMTQPVLVRVREGQMDASERAAFTREANERDTLGLSATERAMADAAAMTDNLLDLYEGGDVDAAGNRPFVRGFLEQIVGRNEQAGMIAADGSMSQEAVRRIEAALLGKAYGDADLVAALVESPDTNIKAIGGALMDVAASWAQMRSDAAAGDIEPNMDQTEGLLGAIRVIQKARRERRSISEFVGQRDILSGEALDPMAEAFLTLMFRNVTNWTQPASRDKIREGLAYYLDQAGRSQPGADLLGETAPEPGRILAAARERQYGTEAEQEAQQDLLAQPPRRPGEGERAARPGGEERPAEGRQEPVQQEPAGARPEAPRSDEITEEAFRARRRRDKAFKAALQHIGDPHPAGAGQQFMRGWLDAEAGRTMDESQVSKPTAGMGPRGFNPIDYYRSAYASQRLGEPTLLRTLDDTPVLSQDPRFQTVSLEEARQEIEAAGGTITSEGTHSAFRPGEEGGSETEFFTIQLRQADGMPVVMRGVTFPTMRMDLDRWLEIPNRTGRPAGLGALAGGRPAADQQQQGIPEPQWWKDLTGAQRSDRLEGAGIRGTARTPWSRLTPEQQRALDQQWGYTGDEFDQSGWRRIGENEDGRPLFEDGRGVRSYMEGGARITESVGIVPGAGIQIDKEARDGRFLTDEERAGEAPATEQERRDREQHDIFARRIDDMEDPAEIRQYAEELRTMLMTDERTGLGSNRAWLNREPKAFIASIDMDSLGWVNDNMGHPAGDQLIELVGRALREAGLADDAFHVSGDEFYAHSDSREDLEAALQRAQEWLAEQSVEDGGYLFRGPGFSYGVGSSIRSAEDALHAEKTRRTEAGERAPKGEQPRGAAVSAQAPKPERVEGDRTPAAEAGGSGQPERPATEPVDRKRLPGSLRVSTPQELVEELGLLENTRANIAGETPDRAALIVLRDMIEIGTDAMNDGQFPAEIRRQASDLSRRITRAIEDGGDLSTVQQEALGLLDEWIDGRYLDQTPDLAEELLAISRIIQRTLPPAVVDTDDADPETQRLSAHFSQQFADGASYRSITDARREAGEVLGRTVEAGTQDAKLVDEAVELGVVVRSRQIVREAAGDAQRAYAALVDLYGRMPNLSTRTSTSVAQQAYSTPVPLGYIAARAAGISTDALVYEPSAGNGALLLNSNPVNVLANELNPDRAANLRAIMPESLVTTNDASVWRPKRAYDVVIGNPPFGTVRDANGDPRRFRVNDRYETGEIDHAIALKSLEAMQDDGSAVLIVGSVNKQARSEEARSDAYNGKAKREFYLTLYGEYNVIDHFTVAGELYERQGAGWPVDVIVIRGRGRSSLDVPAAAPPRVYDSWNSLGEVLNADYPSPASLTRPTDGDRPRESPESTVGDGRDRARSGEARPDRQRSARPPREPADVRPGPVDREPGDTRPAESPPRDIARPAEGERPAQRPRRDPVKAEGENLRQVSYQPGSTTQPMGTLVPVNMQTSVQNALDGLRQRVGDLDHFVATHLGYEPGELGQYFGAEQVDAIALALDNMENGAGFIIGDQTGIGKGRVVAAVIRYALREGRTPIFVTEKPNLYGDMYRDLKDIGVPEMLGRDPDILMTNAAQTVPLDDDGKKKLKTGSAMSHNTHLMEMVGLGHLKDYDMVFTTYSQMQTLQGEPTPRMQFLEAMGRNGIVIFDESHNAGGSLQQAKEGERGGADQTIMNRALFARNLSRSASGVLYSSATYAKRPEVMDLYATTDMRLAVSDINNLAEAIQKGGVPMQQVVASMLARSGQYLRRERSFDGVTYNAPVVEVPRETYGHYSRALAEIQTFSDGVIKRAVKAMDKELKKQGRSMGSDSSVGGAGATSTNFTSVMHNLIDQMLLSIKADQAADRAIAAIENGEKPVITVANTMGSFIKDYVEDLGLSPGDRVDLTFNDLLERYLVRTRWISVRQPFMKKGEKAEKVYLDDSTLGPSGVKKFEEIRERLREIDLSGLPVSPIDHIRMRLTQAGRGPEGRSKYKVGEITGRTHTLDYRQDGNYYRTRPGKEVSIAGRRKAISQFNGGEIDAMIINQAGSTGLSLHASETFRDQKKRRMILAQAEKNIDTHMQMLGRVHRTGQVVTPEYDQLVADVPAEKRPAAVLAKKMASLNANTTASRGGALMAEDVPDFMNQYGDEVAARVMGDMPEVHRALGAPLKEGTDGFDPTDAMRKVTGRIPLLPIEQQEMIYEVLESEYLSLIEQKEAAGESALEAKTLELDANITERRQVIAPESGDSPFADGVYLEVADVKRLGKPYTTDHVLDMIAEELEIERASLSADDMDAAKQAGRTAARKLLADTSREYESYKREVLDDMETPETRRSTETRLEGNWNRMRSIFNRAPVGQSVKLLADSGNLYGIVTRIQRTGRAKSPVALGSWKVTVALTDASRQITIPMSQLFTHETAPNQMGEGQMVIEQAEKLMEGVTVIRAFDEMQAESRESRQIITGNLLAGFDHVNGRGAIINFTDREGGVRQGILMPRDYEYDKQQSGKPVDFRSAEQVIAFIEQGHTAKTADKAIEVDIEGDRVRFTVAGAKSRGGRYYLDPGILKAAGQDFVKVGNNMRVDVARKTAPAVIEEMKRAGAGFRATDNLSEAHKIVGSVSGATGVEEIPKEAWMRAIEEAEGRGDDLEEPRALYSGYERETDNVQGREGDSGAVSEPRPVATPGQLGLFDAESLGDETASQQARDSFEVAYRQVEVGRIPSGLTRVESREDAAHVLAPVRKHAQETFMVLVTDAEGNALNIIRHSKGARNAASIYPDVVAGAIAATDGAHSVWFAHNHPSGVRDPSHADVLITEKLIDTLDGLDLEFRGHLIFGSSGAVSWFGDDQETVPITPTKAVRRTSLAITERMLRKSPAKDLPEITSSNAARTLVSSMESRNAIVLLSNRHHAVGVISMTDKEMGLLREGGRVARILRGIDKTNASKALIVSEDQNAAKNVARFMNNLGMTPLDVVIWNGDTPISSAERGLDFEHSQGYFFSLREGGNNVIPFPEPSEDARRGAAEIKRAIDEKDAPTFGEIRSAQEVAEELAPVIEEGRRHLREYNRLNSEHQQRMQDAMERGEDLPTFMNSDAAVEVEREFSRVARRIEASRDQALEVIEPGYLERGLDDRYTPSYEDLFGEEAGPMWQEVLRVRSVAAGRPTQRDTILRIDDRFARDAEAITQDLENRLRELGIADQISVGLRDRIQAVAEGRSAEADARYLRSVIEVSMAAPDQRRALNHEVIHALRDLGLFRDAEWRALEREARADTERFERVSRRYRGLGLSEDAVVEEVVADQYAAWASEQATPTRGFARRAFERIRDFLRALGNALAGRGYRTADSVFRSVERGAVGGRGRASEPIRASEGLQERFALSDPQANDPTAKDGSVARQKATSQWLGSQPMDHAMRLPFHVFGGINQHGEWKWGRKLNDEAARIIQEAAFSENGRFSWINPTIERARAGLIDRYGLAPEYVERERLRGVEERSMLLEAGDILQTLQESNIGPAEAKVLQAVLTGEAVADEDMAKLAEPIRNAIDDMGAEAVRLGLISAESFERNRGAYLHRVYLKHETDQGGISRWIARVAGAQRKKIIGNQFKGRGLWIEVTPSGLMRKIPGFREAERGQAVVGEKFRVLDKVDEGQGTLQDMEPSAQRRVMDRIYLPVDAAIPDSVSGYVDRGVWEVRGKKGGNVVLWRDFTKDERVSMGEIVDARYTIAKTYMVMSHDLATGRFFRDIALNEDWATSTQPRAKTWSDAQEYGRFWADPSIDWVRVPDTTIPKSNTKRYGALSGMYVRAEIWRDLHELDKMQRSNWWNTLLTQWKLNKTARSPVVHMNNIMSNVMLMDLADVRAVDLVQGIVSMIRQDKHYKDARDHGAFGSDIISQEIRRNVLQPILDEIQKDVKGGQDTIEEKIGVVGKLADAIWSKTKGLDRKMVDAYRLEDEVFRMATYMRKLSLGFEPNQAALEARDQFLNYDIRAPWVNAARRSVLPFISYTYRAIPVVSKSVMLRPWKLAKYATVAHVMGSLAYMVAPGDEDEERRSMREHETGYTWVGAPRMIRMPYADQYGNPVFLDVRRWVPAGDVFDMNQGHGAFAIPAWLQFGGPLMLGAEFALNKRSFTGDEIVNHHTDDFWDKAAKVSDWAWKSWMPSAAWIPGSWYWERIGNAATGVRDWQGRPYSLTEAIPSSFGVKLKPQDVDEGFFWKGIEFDRVERELKAQLRRAGRDRERGLLSAPQYDKKLRDITQKLENLGEKRDRTFKGTEKR